MAERFEVIASQLAEVGRAFYGRGWALGTSGNLSAVFSRNPLQLAITPSGVDKGGLDADQILLIDEQTNTIRGPKTKPSEESPLHVCIARECGAGAVFHTHSVWSTTLSDLHAAEGGMAIEGYEMLKGLAGVKTHAFREWLPIIENSQDMTALAGNVRAVLAQQREAHGFLLRRHGLYTWGRDLVEAKRHIEILEFLLEAVGRARLMRATGAEV